MTDRELLVKIGKSLELALDIIDLQTGRIKDKKFKNYCQPHISLILATSNLLTKKLRIESNRNNDSQEERLAEYDIAEMEFLDTEQEVNKINWGEISWNKSKIERVSEAAKSIIKEEGEDEEWPPKPPRIVGKPTKRKK